MSIKTLELELKINREDAGRYSELIKSMESGELCGLMLSIRDNAALVVYRTQLKQAVSQCDFISRRIASGDLEDLVLAGGQVRVKAYQSVTEQRFIRV